MKSPTAKQALAAALSALLILLFFVLLCGPSSSSSSPSSQPLQLQPSVVRVRSRRLLSTQCRDSCSTPVGGFSQAFKAPATVLFESLKTTPKSRSNPSHN
ncbi:hypothetical protein ZEAMMB73_Zm00001d049304 [Zea mays]|uniref:Uncharacterized protein n=1 Tax=Zea mays TaxID=4577 RepID=K7UR08_MAIZE|nr:hypothetical protein ZEAMMB73_Zm00001d049304 [Zea mays]